MRKYYARCKNCDARRVLKKHLEDYLRIPKCRQCGDKRYRAGYPNFRKPKQRTCYCDGYYFPHRDGSGNCIDNPNRESWEKRKNKSDLE